MTSQKRARGERSADGGSRGTNGVKRAVAGAVKQKEKAGAGENLSLVVRLSPGEGEKKAGQAGFSFLSFLSWKNRRWQYRR